MFTIKKNLGYLLLAATILTGCSDSSDEVKAETEQVANSADQKELITTYKEYIEDDFYQFLLKDFHKRFVQGETELEINDDIIEIYNEGLRSLIEEKGVETYLDYGNWLTHDFIAVDTQNLLLAKQKEYEDETLKTLTDFIDGYYEKKYDPTAVDKISGFGYFENNEEVQTLLAFTDALKYGDSEQTLVTLLKTVSPHYSGLKGYEIKKFVESKGIDIFTWVDVYNKENGTMLTEEEGVGDYNPAIGMTTEEVENSSWGKPQSVNRTVTANSVSEQWVYPNYKYLYFENEILTSFQD
ncbi:hypothetical protein B0H99_103302 [Planomicrobium soli]|uniref:Uncharacterized protein n=1 Tax=Planomicrobium soli TaxID=1176648 RepID=A0A2P8H4K9_9BACL|nr:hypothetical protein [Planomicrobium soli]PSL41166.1 hypothetical protein B0H99_103302 [Planomicrobium soli]